MAQLQVAHAPSAAAVLVTTDGFTASWETLVCAVEIVAALGVSLWLLYRRDRILAASSPRSANAEILPLTQPRSFLSVDGLLYFRVATVLFYVVVQVYDMFRTRMLCMIFYTSWNFIAQGVYFAIAAWQTFQVHKQQARITRHGYTELLDESTGFLRDPASPTSPALPYRLRRGGRPTRLELVLDVCLATSILISVVVWTILYPYAVKMHYPEKILNWVSYSQHGINLVILQIDFLSTQHRASLHALPLLIAWPSVYSVFTWILHGTIAKGFWPYPFLEVDTLWAPLWYGGLLFAHLVGFGCVYFISRLK
uniref:Uncharacterized protein n=1 Tax=Globisporangium ultimum (strain ATCC 200006 / CBS 805.95 / DAOM BR144) TaxID=431595 RepID=K3WMT7_GLOUD